MKTFFLIMIFKMWIGPVSVPINPPFESLAACEAAGEAMMNELVIGPADSELMFGIEAGYICMPAPSRDNWPFEGGGFE